MNKSQILQYCHKQSKILGGEKFPSILKLLWDSSKNYVGEVKTKNILKTLKQGTIKSEEFMALLKRYNVNIVYSKEHKEYVVENTDFKLTTYLKGSIYLSDLSIKKLKLSLYRYHSIKEGISMEKNKVLYLVSKLDKGYTTLSDGSISTNSGIIIPVQKGYNDLFYFPENKQRLFIQTCKERVNLEKLKCSEKQIQATIFSIWSIFKTTSLKDIDVQYEIGVISGQKINSNSESRYDLITKEDSQINLIELKRGKIDISTIYYKIGVMNMGKNVNTIYPTLNKTLVFIGNTIDPKIKNLVENLGANKIRLYSYKEYYQILRKKVIELKFNSLDIEMLEYYFITLKNLINNEQ